MLLRSMQNTRRSTDAKAEMMLCVMMLPLVVVGCTRSVCQQWSHHASGVDNAAPPTGRHRWTGLFHPQREADNMQKQLRNPEVY